MNSSCIPDSFKVHILYMVVPTVTFFTVSEINSEPCIELHDFHLGCMDCVGHAPEFLFVLYRENLTFTKTLKSEVGCTKKLCFTPQG